uniref:Uncharacterized protein n=1 Tax=uncultured Desulfobacterium sp. TaxID=201089 RepID=E1YD89_9BACT|nr:unknown protein [uncultured Desulfobacterium sp.]
MTTLQTVCKYAEKLFEEELMKTYFNNIIESENKHWCWRAYEKHLPAESY